MALVAHAERLAMRGERESGDSESAFIMYAHGA
jgi:hypothetical protein